VPSLIGIKGNGKADAAAKWALQLNTTRNKLPHLDFRHTLKSHYVTKWQQHWDDQIFNRLHSVKPVLGERLTGYLKRREELVAPLQCLNVLEISTPKNISEIENDLNSQRWATPLVSTL